MTREVRGRILRGIGANMYGTGITVAVQLAGVPILLHAWGVHLYGEWLVLFSIPAYLAFANLGYSVAVTHDMTIRVARGDMDGALAAFQSLLAMVSVAAVLLLLVMAGVIFPLDIGHWFHTTDLTAVQIQWSLLLLGGEVVAQLLAGGCAAGLTANKQYAVLVMFNRTTMLLQYGGVWVVALLGGGVVGAAAAFCMVRVVAVLAVSRYMLRRHRWLQLGFARVSKRYLREMVAPSLTNMILIIGAALVGQGLVLVVAATLGPVAVTLFAVSRTLARLPLRPAIMVSQTIVPEVAIAEGGNDRLLKLRLYFAALQTGLLLSICAGGLLYVTGGTILRIWTHGKVTLDPALFGWLLASSVAASLWNVSAEMLQAVNRHLRAALVYLVAAVLTVAMGWWLVQLTGKVSGIAIGMFIGDVFFAMYVVPAAVRTLGGKLRPALMEMANPVALMSLAIRRRLR